MTEGSRRGHKRGDKAQDPQEHDGCPAAVGDMGSPGPRRRNRVAPCPILPVGGARAALRLQRRYARVQVNVPIRVLPGDRADRRASELLVVGGAGGRCRVLSHQPERQVHRRFAAGSSTRGRRTACRVAIRTMGVASRCVSRMPRRPYAACRRQAWHWSSIHWRGMGIPHRPQGLVGRSRSRSVRACCRFRSA